MRLDQPHDITDDTVRGVTIVGSPLTELNGTYLEAGSSDGVPMYVHVRKWCLLRIMLPELPELGISVAVSLPITFCTNLFVLTANNFAFRIHIGSKLKAETVPSSTRKPVSDTFLHQIIYLHHQTSN